MKAFHGKQEIKDFYLARVRAHRLADELIHGKYWENGKGCAVGCTIHSNKHAAYETELGIPQVLAKLEDGIFESLPNGISLTWPERFLETINPGADLQLVWPKFAVWLLIDKKYGVLQFARTDESKKVIIDVANTYQSVIDGNKEEINWQRLRNAAYASAYAFAANADYYDSAAYAAYYAANAYTQSDYYASYYSAYYDAAAQASDTAAAVVDAAAAAAAVDSDTAASAYAIAAVIDAAAAAAVVDDAAAAAAADAADTAVAACTTRTTVRIVKTTRHKWRIAQADKLIELLKDAK